MTLNKDWHPMQLYFEDKLTINIVHNLIQHDKINHIETNRHSSNMILSKVLWLQPMSQ